MGGEQGGTWGEHGESGNEAAQEDRKTEREPEQRVMRKRGAERQGEGEGDRGSGRSTEKDKKARGGQQELHGGAACSPRTYILNEKWASGIKHELVGIQHFPVVHLKLDITQVWVIYHGTEVGNQQTERELRQEESRHFHLSLASLTVQVPQLGWWRVGRRTLAFLSIGFLH